MVFSLVTVIIKVADRQAINVFLYCYFSSCLDVFLCAITQIKWSCNRMAGDELVRVRPVARGIK